MKELLQQAKDKLAVFPKAVRETFEKHGIEIREVPKSPVLASVEGTIKTLLEKGKYVLMKDGKEIFRGTKKNVEAFSEILKKLSTKESDNLIERIVKRRNSKLSFSNKATKTLDEFVNNALIKWKNVEERAGATATLEGTLEGKIIQITNYSSKGLIKAQIRAKRHKLVDDWLENIASQKIKNRRNHGRCAEPINISEWLFKAEKTLGIPKNSMKIEQARAVFSDVISKAKRIHNSTESKLAHGLNKSACDSCNPLLAYFNIKEIFKKNKIMKFRKEVQKQFQKAGWYEGRNVKEKFNIIPRFDEYPEFLKVFLYEYGDLEIDTLTENAKGILNLKAIPSKLYDIQYCFETPRYFGNIIAYPIADYHLDSSTLLCDIDGRVYMDGDFPCLVSKDFKTGIEKVIMEDYSDTLEWNPETKEWVEEY